MAEHKYSKNKEDFPIFNGADKAEIKYLMQKMISYLQNIFVILGIKNTNEIEIDTSALFELFNRVEMRRIYFHVFHDGIEMGELNEGCLLCFWILKLMPFKHNIIPTSLLNAKIAYTFFINMLFYEAAKTNRKVNVKNDLYNNVLYAFQYRDLSKEAIMALAESFLY